jgi:phage-related minor tail protein
MTDVVAAMAVEISANTDNAREKLRELETLGDRFALRVGRAFESAAFEGRSLQDTLRNLALDLSRLAFRAAFSPIQSAVSGLFTSVLGATGFAHGGVITPAMPVPFASGGVISAPVTFPMTGGRMGLAGEAGPEAILPLVRGSDGKLGVRHDDAGVHIPVTINITTPDLASFRRSEGQIAAMLSRAVARGQRNL